MLVFIPAPKTTNNEIDSLPKDRKCKTFTSIVKTIIEKHGEPDVVFITPFLVKESVQKLYPDYKYVVDPELGPYINNKKGLNGNTLKYYPVFDESFRDFQRRVLYRHYRLNQIGKNIKVWAITHLCVLNCISEYLGSSEIYSFDCYLDTSETKESQEEEEEEVAAEEEEEEEEEEEVVNKVEIDQRKRKYETMSFTRTFGSNF